MAIETTIVAKNKFVEIGVDVLAPKAMIRSQVSMIALFDVVRSEVFDGLPGSASRAL
jgi:hypothetical protein